MVLYDMRVKKGETGRKKRVKSIPKVQAFNCYLRQ